MQCLSPIFVNSPKGRIFVPCGKCNFCLSNRRSEWTFRLKVEQKASKTAFFLTLTYSPENYPEDGKLKKRDLQLFFKRLRKEQDKLLVRLGSSKNEPLKWPKIKYYACGEYGTETHRAHYHAIMFNLHPDLDLFKLWGLGHVVCVASNGATIHYTTKYIINKEQDDVFALMSKGMGDNYDINADYHRKGSINHVVSEGIPMRMPRYYREKFFSKHQRQVIAVKTRKSIEEQEKKEIDRLSSLHPNPVAYYSEKIHHAHDSVKSKINKRNTF